MTQRLTKQKGSQPRKVVRPEIAGLNPATVRSGGLDIV